MLILPRRKPPSLQQLDVLLPRMHQSDPLYSKLSAQYYRERSGYFGEMSMDYYFSLMQLDLFPMLHGLRLETARHTFQMDTLILFPAFILIIEIKHLAGLIKYQSDIGMLTRENEHGKLERFQDPIQQVDTQRNHLFNFLRVNNFKPMPIHTLTVFSNTNAILQVSENIPDLILAQNLTKRVKQLRQYYKQEHASIQELETMGRFLAGNHTPNRTKLVDKHHVHPSQIKKGVWCTACEQSIMVRNRRSWECDACGHRNRTAHIQAFQEFKQLFGPKISNAAGRSFLNVSTRSIMTRLLNQSGFLKHGKNKGSFYVIS